MIGLIRQCCQVSKKRRKCECVLLYCYAVLLSLKNGLNMWLIYASQFVCSFVHCQTLQKTECPLGINSITILFPFFSRSIPLFETVRICFFHINHNNNKNLYQQCMHMSKLHVLEIMNGESLMLYQACALACPISGQPKGAMSRHSFKLTPNEDK